MRSFRAENVSQFVKHLLDLEVEQARLAYQSLAARYPLVMTRDLLELSVPARWLEAPATTACRETPVARQGSVILAAVKIGFPHQQIWQTVSAKFD